MGVYIIDGKRNCPGHLGFQSSHPEPRAICASRHLATLVTTYLASEVCTKGGAPVEISPSPSPSPPVLPPGSPKHVVGT